MKVAIPKECHDGERRVAASPDSVKKIIKLGYSVAVEAGAGEGASVPDDAFKEAGATIVASSKTLLKDADIVLKVRGPVEKLKIGKAAAFDEATLMKKGAVLISTLDVLTAKERMASLAKSGVTAFAMELMPRISRAQSMDVLSSQSNLAGYKAVIDAAATFGRAFPMMMTAAGTVPPAKVLVMGAGVAGLQAIATARRLGAVVLGYDVRPAVKEQVESLGAKFLEVDPEALKDAETSGGYAKEMSEDYKKKEAEVLAKTVAKQDIIITTALIPGRPAPVLVSEEMLKTMAPGSVIVDLAAAAGGNCPLTEADKVVVKHGVTLIGYTDMPSRLAADTSSLYARNLLNFLTLISGEGGDLAIDWEDEIVKGTLICKDGAVVHPMLTKKEG